MSTVSISELERLRSMAEPGEYEVMGARTIVNHEYDIATYESPSDARCLAAEHNAIPVLLEVVKALLLVREPLDPLLDPGGGINLQRLRSLNAALAKVTP